MKDSYESSRLRLIKIGLDDSKFMMTLMNSAGWLKFIGDRNIRSEGDAKKYIREIQNNPLMNYWTVREYKLNNALGVVTFIKRAYLDFWDIGFAFLAENAGKGYAYEATNEILCDAFADPRHSTIVAITVPENLRSIKLLQRLGFDHANDFEREQEQLSLYSKVRNTTNRPFEASPT